MRDRDAVQVYFPYSQQGGIFGTLAVRTAADPLNFADAVRNAVWSIDKDQPVWKIRTMDNLIQMDVAQDRFLMTLMTCFGMLALALTALGAYGVISYGVSQRTQEFGVRMALGATPHRIMHLVLNRGLGLVLIGSIVGVAAALACSRFMSTLLFGVKANDPSTFAIVMCIMAAVATLSSYLPARRATKVDPMTALRID
jgi:putative ABC transport system permease protein